MTRSGKPPKKNYMVTVTMDHFLETKGDDEAEASRRAIEALQQRWGVGRNPQVTQIEEV